MEIYFILWATFQYCHYLGLNLFQFSLSVASSCCLLCLFDVPLSVFEHCFIFSNYKIFQAHLSFSSPGFDYSSKELRSFHWRIMDLFIYLNILQNMARCDSSKFNSTLQSLSSFSLFFLITSFRPWEIMPSTSIIYVLICLTLDIPTVVPGLLINPTLRNSFRNWRTVFIYSLYLTW